MPAEIGALTSLKYLNLMGNQLEELPQSIGQLSRLYRLGLKSNALRRWAQRYASLCCRSAARPPRWLQGWVPSAGLYTCRTAALALSAGSFTQAKQTEPS